MNASWQEELKSNALNYFLKYVKINSRSNPASETLPSTEEQLQLGKIVVADLLELGITDAEQDEHGYVYATLPASNGVTKPPISFIAHLDTSSSESGENVKPVIHPNYQGEVITFADDPNLILSPQNSPELTKFVGEDIITASGLTLLGADDKAGVAEIMAACSWLISHPEKRHPELKIVFTPDEETGRGVEAINLAKVAPVAYTIDGGEIGELEAECFDAWSVKITFTGRNVHPGSAKNIMLNAGAIAAHFLAALPEWETPEHTEKREGFYHLGNIAGDENNSALDFILRDFAPERNRQRLNYLEQLKNLFLIRYPGLDINIEAANSYQNMYFILKDHPEILQKAEQAYREAGIDIIHNAIRGGTDGARLCYMGIPTPNIFAGGLMYHSKLEWIPVIALQKGAEVIVNLAQLYA
ncbi:MAG: peptidase T [Candidatus Cloacimonadaceae bacterium]